MALENCSAFQAQVETPVRGWIFVGQVSWNKSKDLFQHMGHFLQSPDAFTHFGLLLSGQDTEGPMIMLERLCQGLSVETIPSGSVLRNGAVVVRAFTCADDGFSLLPFVQRQSREYNLVHNNCKHLVHAFYEHVLGELQDFPVFCRQVESMYADWVHHPWAAAALNSMVLPHKDTLPVVFESHDTDSVFFIGAPHLITELSRGQYNSWQWTCHHHVATGVTPGQALVLVNRDWCRHIFYMKDDNILGEMFIGRSSDRTWSHHSHKVSGASKDALLTGGANCGGVFVFWTGNGRLGHMHQGQYNNWTWDHGLHKVPVELKQPITMVCSDNCQKVFWTGEGSRMFEFHMGCYNNWRWELASHDIPGTDACCHLVGGCNSEGEHVFWASAQGKISELYNVKSSGWRWQQATYTAPSVRRHQPLSLCLAGGDKRVFWTDDRGNWQQLHGRNAHWTHKSLCVGGAHFLLRPDFLKQ
eukprot:CAMPEP_0194523674 /NCGR_PEP_ID=MMETSP0253-20130528/58619_1 /TAXON_ID=2966 /ORGANISM="Noctiluca scintillans" /LENGTH=470 /DNA_ID=CAMNT_0039368235 /DNA_START=51 /DNA_END=1463 /DNA_ORIENTATION=+